MSAAPDRDLEAKTDHLLMTTLRDMGETACNVTDRVATDGGSTVDDLAHGLGKHPATIYRAVQDLGDVLERDDFTERQRQEIAETLSTRAVGFEFEANVSVTTKGKL